MSTVYVYVCIFVCLHFHVYSGGVFHSGALSQPHVPVTFLFLFTNSVIHVYVPLARFVIHVCCSLVKMLPYFLPDTYLA